MTGDACSNRIRVIIVFVLVLLSGSITLARAADVDETPLVDPFQSQGFNNQYYVLYSDQSGLYAVSPDTSEQIYIGRDFPIPVNRLATPALEVDDPLDWPLDITVSAPYSFYSGLISPFGDELVYVEAVCSRERCISDYNVWLVDLISHKRLLLFANPTQLMDGQIPRPIAWDGSVGDSIYFDTYNATLSLPLAGIWRYSVTSNELYQVELGFGYYNGRLWPSPNSRFLLTTGANSDTISAATAIEYPTSNIKLLDLATQEVRIIADDPQGQNYYHVRGWISSQDLPDLIEAANVQPLITIPQRINEAYSGFQRPMTNDHYGYVWLQWTGSVYHPGDDYNGPGSGDADCGTDIYAVADGVVRYVNTSAWGGIVIEHNYQGTTVYSQYGHVSTAFVSPNQTVSKGQHIADMGRVSTATCHLHWEIREADHPDPTNGSYYTTSVLNQQSNVENYYEDPEWWVDNHGSYGGSSCPGPSLNSPSDGYISTSQTINFSWSAVSGCTFNGYTFRIKDTATMDSGGTTIVDTGVGGTSRTETIGSQWNNRDLYWGVRAANAPNGANWSVRRFRIEPGTTGDVLLCTSDDGQSGCWIFPVGVYPSLVDWGLNDVFRSVRVPSGKSVFLFRQDLLRSTAECYSSDRTPLPEGHPWDLRGQVTSVQVFDQSACPTSQLESVVLYDSTNYGSYHWGMGNAAGLYNVTDIELGNDWFNDRAESIRIPTGLSVKVYEHDNGSGASSNCLTGAVGDLGSLKNQVTSVEIFHNSSCTPPVPDAPTLVSPANGAILPRTTNVTLDWNSSSGATEYYVELWGGQYPDPISPDWTTDTFWPIGGMWGGTYQWHVKAKNNAGQSGWSWG